MHHGNENPLKYKNRNWIKMQMQVRARLWLLLSLLAIVISCVYMFTVLLPWEHYIGVEVGKLKAPMGDLYSPWMGTRELLLFGRNPYGPEVSHEIQMAFYGHAIDQTYGEPGVNAVDEQRFAYPVYVVFLLAPTVHVEFSRLRVWASAMFAVLTAISVLLWLDVAQWRPSKALIAAIVLFVLGSPQVMQGLRLRQIGLVVGFLLALAVWCVVRNHLAIGGVLLALSTIKPQMVVLPLAWLLIWGASALRRRWPLLAGFGITLATLVGWGELILPGWPRHFVDGLIAYRQYVPIPVVPLLCVALGNWVGGALSGIIVFGLLALAWRNRQADAASPEFRWTLGAFFVGATLALPLITSFNQVLLLLPLIMIVRDWTALPRTGRSVLALVVAWPWMASFALLLLHPRLDSTAKVPLIPSALVLFLPFLLLMLLVTRLNRAHEQQIPTTEARLP